MVTHYRRGLAGLDARNAQVRCCAVHQSLLSPRQVARRGATDRDPAPNLADIRMIMITFVHPIAGTLVNSQTCNCDTVVGYRASECRPKPASNEQGFRLQNIDVQYCQ